MADEPENLVIEHLRYIRAAIDRIEFDVRDLKHRVSSLEIAEANHYTSLLMRADRSDDRLERIEKRLGLIEAAP
jgi:hypothetical protein